VTYDEFKKAWIWALRESALPVLSIEPVEETLGLCMMDRTCKSFVEPLGGQDTEPFHVSASLAYRWDAFHTARMITNEEDLLTELFGRTEVRRRTSQPWLRVDVVLRASLQYGKAMAMPPPAAWAKWAREAMGRLESIEPAVPVKRTRKRDDLLPDFLAWESEPEARVICKQSGELRLQGVEIASWQPIDLPRKWDDPSRRPDKRPEDQLVEMFGRVKAALAAWMEVLDHLRPRR
jgi:hypothetical protein